MSAPVHAIAIVAASVEDWDDHFRALVADSRAAVHFAHGVPAVSGYAGQQCAALAEVMLHGLSHDRVIRALRRVSDCHALEKLPKAWYTKLAREAPLLVREHWDFELARIADEDGSDFRPVLEPLLDVLGAGPEAAEKAGEMLLSGQALAIWNQALLDAPPASAGDNACCATNPGHDGSGRQYSLGIGCDCPWYAAQVRSPAWP